MYYFISIATFKAQHHFTTTFTTGTYIKGKIFKKYIYMNIKKYKYNKETTFHNPVISKWITHYPKPPILFYMLYYVATIYHKAHMHLKYEQMYH